MNAFIEQEGQIVLGWRTVPVNVGKIGTVAQSTCPYVRQVFIGAANDLKDSLAFERKLYVIRKQAENWGVQEQLDFYFASLSSQTIVYKGLLTPEQVDAFIWICRMKPSYLHFHSCIQGSAQIPFLLGNVPIRTAI